MFVKLSNRIVVDRNFRLRWRRSLRARPRDYSFSASSSSERAMRNRVRDRVRCVARIAARCKKLALAQISGSTSGSDWDAQQSLRNRTDQAIWNPRDAEERRNGHRPLDAVVLRGPSR